MKKKIEQIVEQLDEEIMEKDYSPLTKEDYDFISVELSKINNYMPTHLMTPFWTYKNTIENSKEPQPCGCKSSGHHWMRCINVLREYIKK